MTGYQEILTDPSYCRQIVTLTYPHIGNVGVNAEDVESRRVYAAGLVIRDLPRLASSWRAHGRPRRRTCAARQRRRHRRHRHAQADAHPAREGRAERLHRGSGRASDADAEARDRARARRAVDGRARPRQGRHRARQPYEWNDGALGARQRLRRDGRAALPRRRLRLRRQAQHPAHAGRARLPRDRGAGADAGARSAARCKPDGVFLSNGPGDPEPCDYAIAAIRELVDSGMPTFGICLGHQLLGLASGAQDA